MIRRLQQIKAFGVFTDFNWPTELPEFKKYNLIYGWNYSGKTTLSRAFRCFETKSSHPDFTAAQVHLKTEDGVSHHLSTPYTAPALRVFNSDFVRDNLRFGDGSAEPILVLGDEDIAKQEALKVKVAEQEALGPIIAKDRQNQNELNTSLENALTRYARDFIKIPLEVVNYDKRQFKPLVDACKDAADERLLDDAALAGVLQVYNSKDKKPPLAIKIANLTLLATLKNKADALFKRVVTAANTIPRLKNDPTVESWVRSGRPLHVGKDSC